jgi:hypothetical protein
MLLEQGKLLDIEGDLALMPTPESGYKRADAFDALLHSTRIMDSAA